ncbi:MAG: FeoC-like transcriptional regulator [Chromatiales bacterium]|jgi:hypothetical protein
MLAELRRLLRSRGAVSLAEAAQHLDASPEAVRGMLEHWIRKGRVRRLTPDRCRCCTACGPDGPEVYVWVDEADGAGEPPRPACPG